MMSPLLADTITSREISELILDIKRKITPLQLLSHTWPVQSLRLTIMILKDGIIHAEGSYKS
jgi:hypothetical protein